MHINSQEEPKNIAVLLLLLLSVYWKLKLNNYLHYVYNCISFICLCTVVIIMVVPLFWIRRTRNLCQVRYSLHKLLLIANKKTKYEFDDYSLPLPGECNMFVQAWLELRESVCFIHVRFFLFANNYILVRLNNGSHDNRNWCGIPIKRCINAI